MADAAVALANLDLPPNLVSLVYRCPCGVKSTYGRDYMVQVGALPESCGECETAFDHATAQAVLD